MRLLSSHSWHFFLYTAGLAFSSLNMWELAFFCMRMGSNASCIRVGPLSLLYKGGLGFSSLNNSELTFLLYTSGTVISLYRAGTTISLCKEGSWNPPLKGGYRFSLYKGGVRPLPVYESDRSFDLGMRPVRQCDLHLRLFQD